MLGQILNRSDQGLDVPHLRDVRERITKKPGEKSERLVLAGHAGRMHRPDQKWNDLRVLVKHLLQVLAG